MVEWKITTTKKYQELVTNQASVIELAKVESLQAIAEQLEDIKKDIGFIVNLADQVKILNKRLEDFNFNLAKQ